ncbi:MAG: AzlD domain-containing protein [Oscillospiraceae bacterium]|nr:AzlD domain-containing protein [Oscillospiraceae bacterium]
MSIYIYILAMAVTTYLIRVLPLTVFRKPIRSRFLKSFLHYVPYACLTAMTFPAILTSTQSVLSGVAALIAAVILAFRGKSLLVVSVASCCAVFVTEQLLKFIL